MASEREGLSLHLERTIRAPRAAVFWANVDRDALAAWWGPQGFRIPSVELDLRVGGRYRITMQPPEGEPFHLSGEFRAIEPETQLVYTFRWEEPDPDDRETVATLTFEAIGEGTRVRVDHHGFATEARRALHVAGWTESLERLARHVERR